MARVSLPLADDKAALSHGRIINPLCVWVYIDRVSQAQFRGFQHEFSWAPDAASVVRETRYRFLSPISDLPTSSFPSTLRSALLSVYYIVYVYMRARCFAAGKISATEVGINSPVIDFTLYRYTCILNQNKRERVNTFFASGLIFEPETRFLLFMEDSES